MLGVSEDYFFFGWTGAGSPTTVFNASKLCLSVWRSLTSCCKYLRMGVMSDRALSISGFEPWV